MLIHYLKHRQEGDCDCSLRSIMQFQMANFRDRYGVEMVFKVRGSPPMDGIKHFSEEPTGYMQCRRDILGGLRYRFRANMIGFGIERHHELCGCDGIGEIIPLHLSHRKERHSAAGSHGSSSTVATTSSSHNFSDDEAWKSAGTSTQAQSDSVMKGLLEQLRRKQDNAAPRKSLGAFWGGFLGAVLGLVLGSMFK